MALSLSQFIINVCSLVCVSQLLVTHAVASNSNHTQQQRFLEYADASMAPLETPPLQALAYTTNTANIVIRTVEFTGSDVIEASLLQTTAAAFLNRQLDSGDLEELRYRITRMYVDQGYINSGAVLDNYNPTTQHLKVRIHEGQLGAINVATDTRLEPAYIANRLRIAGTSPLHLPTIQERILVLLEDPVIDSIHGAISPSSTPGTADLAIEASGKRPYGLQLILDNQGPVSLGEERATIVGTLRNPIGLGEIANLNFNTTAHNRRGRLDLSIPITAYDTRLRGAAETSNATVAEEPIDLLDVKSSYRAYDLGITQPLIHTPQNKLNLGLTLSHRNNKTRLLGMPFCFNQGCVDGQTTTTALRFNQEWITRSTSFAYTINSTISFGLDTMGATRAKTGNVDNRFVTWLLQQRYAQQWWHRRLQLMGRIDLQITDTPLPILEQITIGGMSSVRGYRENVTIRDQTILGSLELRYAILGGEASDYGRIEGAIFTDAAHSWNKQTTTHGKDLHSVGLGLLWTWQDTLSAQLYWAHQLKTEPKPRRSSWSLQDEGFHFQLQATY